MISEWPEELPTEWQKLPVDLALLQPGITNDTNFANSNATTNRAQAYGA